MNAFAPGLAITVRLLAPGGIIRAMRRNKFYPSVIAVTMAVALALGLWLSGERDGGGSTIEIRQAVRDEPATGRASYADAVALAAPSVVNIYTSRRVAGSPNPFADDPFFRFFFGDRLPPPGYRTQTSLGSGVILSTDGYMLTNHHVIANADEIEVLLADGRTFDARVIGSDPESDLAVLHIRASGLEAITVGRSTDLRVGDVVLAIGNPYGVGQTVTSGIVSALGRSRLGISTFEDFIQTDAAINPGNSGGALINAHGDLIGINTAIFTRSGGSQGIGFAIPIHLALDVMEQLIERGRVVRGWLGIEMQEMTPQLAESFGIDGAFGVVVAGVLRGGPAERGGLMPGDVIRTINGREIADSRDALDAIARRAPGEEAVIEGIRAGEPLRLSVKVGERPTG